MNLGENFDSSMVKPMVMIVASVKRHIGQGYYKSGKFVGILLISPFLPFFLSW